MISVPFQFNYDQNIGPVDDGHKTYVNFQPVIPHQLNDDWNLITRVILPIADQSDIFPGAGSQFGLGDITASLFFSPIKPTSSGWIWAIGPVFYIPNCDRRPARREEVGHGVPPHCCCASRTAGPTARSSITSGRSHRSGAIPIIPTSATRSSSRS